MHHSSVVLKKLKKQTRAYNNEPRYQPVGLLRLQDPTLQQPVAYHTIKLASTAIYGEQQLFYSI